jgi:hypothetical protein
LRINDLEDGGLSVFFAQSGLTKIYDANGLERIDAEMPETGLGTEGDDVIINLRSAVVNAGGGTTPSST